MEKIIAALDLQPQTDLVVEKAMEMAKKFDAPLHLLHVVAPISAYAATNMVDPLAGVETVMLPNEIDLIETQKNIAQERLAEICERLYPYKVAIKILVGAVEEEVVNYAREVNAGLIVVGTHHRSGLSRLLNGETSVRILHEARIPILVVPTPEDK